MRKATINVSGVMWIKVVGLTNGGIYCQLLASPSSEMVFASFKTNATSMILAAPAAIREYPNTVWTMVLSGRCWGCADMAHPVMKITKPGMKFLLGAPSLFLLSQTPVKPAHHQMTPIVVC